MSSVGILGPDHVALSVGNLADMTKWYSDVLGLIVERHFNAPEFKVRATLMKGPGELRVELIEHPESHANKEQQFAAVTDLALQRGYGHIAMRVRGVDHAFHASLEAGAKPALQPRPSLVEGQRIAVIFDPEGNHIEFVEDIGNSQGSAEPASSVERFA
jgi:catechol 2,3-dioxygenase-like lactoylglutathione lyase family enzyme